MTKKHLFLNLPGGGVRGAVTNQALMGAEEATGLLLKDIFTAGMGGTSTGSALIAGIQCGKPTTAIAGFYRRTGEVFNHSPEVANALAVTRGYKFDIHNLYNLVNSVLGPDGQRPLNSFPNMILIPVMGRDGKYRYLTQDRPTNAAKFGSVRLIDACVGSSAAPVYFQSWDIPGVGSVVDGGVGVAGNPVFMLAVEAFRFNTFKPEESIIVSVGTGRNPDTYEPPESNLLSEVSWLLNVMLEAPKAQAPSLVRTVFPDCEFYEFDIDLPHKIDMADSHAVPQLEEIGRALKAQIPWKDILQVTAA
jgi:patatin-like phospholipase/acyl hydrolase